MLDEHSENSIPNETGGVIMGFMDTNHIYITHIITSGPNAQSLRYKFKRDKSFTKKEIDRIFVETNGNCDYLGEWHSHTFNCPISLLDKISLLTLSLNPFNNVENPILLINIKENNNWRKDIFICQGVHIKQFNKTF